MTAYGSGPILTTAKLNSLLSLKALTGNTTITYMSDEDYQTEVAKKKAASQE